MIARLLYGLTAHTMTVIASADTEPLDTTASAVRQASTLVLGYSGEDWDRWLIISVGLAAIVAVAIGFSAAASVMAHRREAQVAAGRLETYKQAVAAKVAEARDAGVRAGRDAADALAKAAEANARAQEAGLQLEIERNRRLPRNISEAQRSQLIAALRTMPRGHVMVRPNLLDTEASNFADEIKECFVAADYPLVTMDVRGLAGVVDPGLKIIVRTSTHRPATAEPLVHALHEIGGDNFITTDDLVPDNDSVVIFVGRKPD